MSYLLTGILPILFISHVFAETNEIKNYFLENYGYSDLDKKIVELLIEELLDRNLATIPASETNSIAVYAFGNRLLPNGNRMPGPVNKELADLAVDLYKHSGAHVYAQWEVAECIGDRIPKAQLTSINPSIDEQGNIVYLTTLGVAEKIIEIAQNKGVVLGKVAVIGFHDHVGRCVDTSRLVGMDAYVPQGYQMPAKYDPLSGQPWTRNRLASLQHELIIRLETIGGNP